MKKSLVVFGITFLFSLFIFSSVQASPPDHAACWGQASAVFAQTGEMGEHSSSQGNPRIGLRNLARVLFDAGIIPDDTMQELGVFVANELGLSIDACS